MGFKERLRGLRKRYTAHREGQRAREITRAKEEIGRSKVLVERDVLRARSAEAKQRMVRAGGGSFKERMQYGQGDIFGRAPPPAQRRPRQSRPRRRRTRRRRAPPKQKSAFERMMWG